MKRGFRNIICAAGLAMLAGAPAMASAQSDMKDVKVKIRMLVLSDGTVLECHLIRTSGRPKLDKAACRGAKRYGAKPSVDADGNPKDAWRMEEVIYQVPR